MRAKYPRRAGRIRPSLVGSPGYAMDQSSIGKMYEVGDIIAGRYRVQRVLGIGGMGVVVAARHEELDTLVAIKMLRPEILMNRDVVARFAAEARAAVRIKSEHVARVTDVGTLPEGSPYMVMEYLEGSDLAELVQKRGKLPLHEAVDYVLQACEALAEAHSLGIIHRDLKPGNLFLCRRADGSELVKVLDFGISKTTGTGSNPSLTGTSTLLGSPTYMSPEQLSSSKSVDCRTDIWALGIILHEILSGEVPFRSDTLPELFLAIVQKQPPGLEQLRPDLPRGFAEVVLRCLEKDRSRRFENVGQLAVALAEFAPQRSHISIERILRLVPAPTTPGKPLTSPDLRLPTTSQNTVHAVSSSETQGTWGQTAAKTKRSPAKAVLLGVLALGCLAAGAVALRGVIAKDPLVAPPASAVGATSPSSTAPAEPTRASELSPTVAPVAANQATSEPVAAPSASQVSAAAPPASPENVAVPPRVVGRVTGRVHAPPGARHTQPSQTSSPAEPASQPVAAPARPAATPAATPAAVPTPAPPPKKNGNEWEEDRR